MGSHEEVRGEGPPSKEEWRAAMVIEEVAWEVEKQDNAAFGAAAHAVAQFKRGLITEKEMIEKIWEVKA